MSLSDRRQPIHPVCVQYYVRNRLNHRICSPPNARLMLPDSFQSRPYYCRADGNRNSPSERTRRSSEAERGAISICAWEDIWEGGIESLVREHC